MAERSPQSKYIEMEELMYSMASRCRDAGLEWCIHPVVRRGCTLYEVRGSGVEIPAAPLRDVCAFLFGAALAVHTLNLLATGPPAGHTPAVTLH